ncbi:uncharacterized protein PGTG_19804 [Puccinia graminis f. sp. tritici CRL 75-36-700-3]|uniref:DUF4203 domain-containing protein n=1 Tax=Puccinia graminis f. sp. tritici (strain CRL 75-36-700-3 / race SCCL) TaxID=418459 RepID=E3LB52_PUCGT|nr:uncharacterized protein PGTG_19804 [Puccinia graminis f. sp. tritici CRL 75-36-700-3]EFP93777.2 hypothetical protein PGTG_19804 [Puccinia graminis f. sp. tritici CRL 75-36-700-3]
MPTVMSPTSVQVKKPEPKSLPSIQAFFATSSECQSTIKASFLPLPTPDSQSSLNHHHQPPKNHSKRSVAQINTTVLAVLASGTKGTVTRLEPSKKPNPVQAGLDWDEDIVLPEGGLQTIFRPIGHSTQDIKKQPSFASAISDDSLLFSIPTTILGLILLLLGRTLPRFYSSVAFALAIAFPTWALSLNLAGVSGITGRSYSQDTQNIIIWALVSGTFFFGLSLSLLIGQHGYPIALFLLSIQAGLAITISISILIFSNGLTIHHTLSRSIFLAIGPSISGLITIIC